MHLGFCCYVHSCNIVVLVKDNVLNYFLPIFMFHLMHKHATIGQLVILVPKIKIGAKQILHF